MVEKNIELKSVFIAYVGDGMARVKATYTVRPSGIGYEDFVLEREVEARFVPTLAVSEIWQRALSKAQTNEAAKG